MKESNEKRLYLRFPRLYREPLQWGFEHGDGWYDLVYRLSETIERAAAEAGVAQESDEYPLARQVKEKFGRLRFYVSYCPENAEDALDAAEIESAGICYFCGAPAEMRTSGGWYRPACDRHARTR